MAEVIGVVEGALTFATVAAQVTKSIITIKDCWDQFRDAPTDLRLLMRELDMFGLILADIQEDLLEEEFASALTGNKLATQSLIFSKRAAASCRELARDIR